MRMRHVLGLVILLGLLGFLTQPVAAQFGGGSGRGNRGGRGGGGSSFDPKALFDKLSGGKGYLVIADVKWGREGYEKFAKDENITDGKLTKDQYVKYFEQQAKMRSSGNGSRSAPSGASPQAPSPEKRDAPNPFGIIKAFMGGPSGPGGPGGEKAPAVIVPHPVSLAPAPAPAPDERVVVYRAGKLPKGLPDWFEKLDTDRDGQVSLAEWRADGKSLEEFKAMDLNDDGLLTPEEVLQYLASHGKKE